jgi:hypothetical protein
MGKTRILSRNEKGEPTGWAFSESKKERAARIEAANEEAKKTVSLTPGQEETLRKHLTTRSRNSWFDQGSSD